ncbi:N-acetylglucosamine kinase-like BadF-type ATPase [Rhizobium sp. BK529]|uniref:N-acetylglucosamine kinase n=1 Tax=unclassified Rhizobium TaxID=2613769 RepID=UPI00105049D0|nr:MULTISPECIES: BadF/BadG/BcrA/BcrD ATPase family protein [unclassified Rhizobium]MBB3593626.1 N-acetylglucosamine kinase-like BadF-type ATPase [Rhizobium sp. BK529]TCS03414.1 N-acetylglucosamine kinase-like BadF-type ATPase [Rhizobium sp. BK418]
MSEELILGIDGGGSKVLVTLAGRDGRVLRSALGGGVNPMDNPDWRQELERHIEPFRREAGLAAVGAALPAYGEVAYLSTLQKQCIDEIFPDVSKAVLNDVDAAHLGAFAGRPGILILSGTGSMSWARNAAGASARAGGWGDMIGDEGSSYWIGRTALHLISQSLDGRGKPTALATAIYDHLQLDISDPINALGGWINGLAMPRAGIAALSILVDRTAQQGDETAIGLIEEAADELAKHHSAIASHCEAGTDWTYAGGTFSSRRLLEAVERRIGQRAIAPVLPPIGGALLAAAQLLDWPLDEGWLGQIAVEAEAVIARSRQ